MFRRIGVACGERALARAKDGKVDPVVNDADGILLEKRLAYQRGEPLGGRDDGQVFHAAKPAFFVFVHRLGRVDVALRVEAVLRTVVAAALPFHTAAGVKMRAVTREGPTVVQGPKDADAVFFDVVEQHRQV